MAPDQPNVTARHREAARAVSSEINCRLEHGATHDQVRLGTEAYAAILARHFPERDDEQGGRVAPTGEGEMQRPTRSRDEHSAAPSPEVVDICEITPEGGRWLVDPSPEPLAEAVEAAREITSEAVAWKDRPPIFGGEERVRQYLLAIIDRACRRARRSADLVAHGALLQQAELREEAAKFMEADSAAVAACTEQIDVLEAALATARVALEEARRLKGHQPGCSYITTGHPGEFSECSCWSIKASEQRAEIATLKAALEGNQERLQDAANVIAKYLKHSGPGPAPHAEAVLADLCAHLEGEHDD